MPYSVKIVGSMTIGLASNIVCALVVLLSTLVYLMVRNNMQKLYFDKEHQQQETNNADDIIEDTTNEGSHSEGIKQLSISDICYILYGRSSIFMVNICLFISILGFNVMFFLFIAQTVLSLFIDVNIKGEELEKRTSIYKVLIIFAVTLT